MHTDLNKAFPNLLSSHIQDLVEAFRDELSGDFEDLCIVMVTDDLIFDVKAFRHFIEVCISSSESRSLEA